MQLSIAPGKVKCDTWCNKTIKGNRIQTFTREIFQVSQPQQQHCCVQVFENLWKAFYDWKTCSFKLITNLGMLQKVTQEKNELSTSIRSTLESLQLVSCVLIPYESFNKIQKKSKCMSSAEYIYTWGDDLTNLNQKQHQNGCRDWTPSRFMDKYINEKRKWMVKWNGV